MNLNSEEISRKLDSALDKLRSKSIPDEHWKEVKKYLEESQAHGANSLQSIKVNEETYRMRFSL